MAPHISRQSEFQESIELAAQPSVGLPTGSPYTGRHVAAMSVAAAVSVGRRRIRRVDKLVDNCRRSEGSYERAVRMHLDGVQYVCGGVRVSWEEAQGDGVRIWELDWGFEVARAVR